MEKKTSRSPTSSKRKVVKKKLKPHIEVEHMHGFRDRITASLGAKVQIEKYVFDASPFFSLSTDVGMYDADETLDEAKERASNFVSDALGEVLEQLETEKKRRAKKK